MRRPGWRRCPMCDGECTVEVKLEPVWIETGPSSGRWAQWVRHVACPNPQCDDGEIRVCVQCEEEMPQGDTAERCGPCVEANKEEMQGVQS